MLAKSRCQQGSASSKSSRGDSIPCFLQLLPALVIPWFVTPVSASLCLHLLLGDVNQSYGFKYDLMVMTSKFLSPSQTSPMKSRSLLI